ncbi:MAG: hypothetical protein HY242_09840 [Afipia sp.]|nr:hypothetical protein [Afipia sp.]
MVSRALNLAAVIFMLCGLASAPAGAENLEAGKPPSAIFSSTCSLCHKSSRGLLKTVAPGSLPGFLRQHYTTSTDMAAAMSAYVLSNGAANAALPGGNLTKQGEESKRTPKPDSKPDVASRDEAKDGQREGAKGRKPTREASRPDVDGLENIPGAPEPSPDEQGKPPENPKLNPKQKGAKGKPPKPEVASVPPKEEVSRPDPVPAVTPAPQDNQTPPVPQGPKSVADLPTGPLTIDLGAPTPSVAAVQPAGPPRVPISQ